MATLQAFCEACQEKVSAHTVLSDDDTLSALERSEDVRIVHLARFPDGTGADHVWSLSGQEKERLHNQMTGKA
jgi:hypothetical protein